MWAMVVEVINRLQNLPRLRFSNRGRCHSENIDIALGNEITAMSERAVQQNTSQIRSEMQAQDIGGLRDEGAGFIVTVIPVHAHRNRSGSLAIRVSQKL